MQYALAMRGYFSRAGRRDASGSCVGRALVARAWQGGELARQSVLRQRRPPAAPSLLAARDMSLRRPVGRPVKSNDAQILL